jgi:hypothetical protein
MEFTEGVRAALTITKQTESSEDLLQDVAKVLQLSTADVENRVDNSPMPLAQQQLNVLPKS